MIAHNLDGFCVRQRAEDVAEAILRLLDDPAMRLSMGRAGAEKLRERWDWDRVIDRVEDAYGRALGASRTNVKVLA
ncbi:MAG: glycosyltransferase family 4 protein [Chloroflexi bacterium]|nr:MAG: glycosyltransferase family 4 protein [Chloroflexota bacterium]